jgi:hypothetical protein
VWWVEEKGWGGEEKFALGTYCYGVKLWRYKLDVLFVGILSEVVFMLSGIRVSEWSSVLRFAAGTSLRISASCCHH